MVSWGINPVFTGLFPTHGQVTYALLTRAPLATRGAAARLACVRPVASVHPEPGSNSSLYSLSLIPPQWAEPLTVLFEDSDAGCQSQLLTVKLCLALALP